MVLTTVGIMLPCATDIQRLRRTRDGERAAARACIMRLHLLTCLYQKKPLPELATGRLFK
jgi:hypothetical protein